MKQGKALKNLRTVWTRLRKLKLTYYEAGMDNADLEYAEDVTATKHALWVAYQDAQQAGLDPTGVLNHLNSKVRPWSR